MSLPAPMLIARLMIVAIVLATLLGLWLAAFDGLPTFMDAPVEEAPPQTN